MELYQGDCLEVMDKLIEKGIKADCIITDPPYKTTSRGRGKSTTTGGILNNKLFNSGKPFNIVQIEDYIDKLYAILKDTGHCYIMTNNKNLTHFLNTIDKSNFNYVKVLIWDKVSPLPNQFYMDRHEYIILLRKGKAVKVNNNSIPSILNVKTVNKNGIDYEKHLTEKPVDLMKILISQSSQKDELIFDPFLGNGSTAIASKKLKRKCIGIELEEKYCEIAKNRLQNTNININY